MRSRPYRRLRDLVISAHGDNMWVVREDLARRYLSGTGIEIPFPQQTIWHRSDPRDPVG